MRTIAFFIGFLGIVFQAQAQHVGHSIPHEMQHGFVLAADDKFASHLVASGHHSRQTEITGHLLIDDQQEMEFYQQRKIQSAGGTYFLFQAQNLNLPTLSDGHILKGHIVESKTGGYEPKNIIVHSAVFKVEKVLLNILNPFFIEEEQVNSPIQTQSSSLQEDRYLNGLINTSNPKKAHCCDTGKKPCNWKC